MSPVVVYDGYRNGPSSKDRAHQRKTRSIVASKISGLLMATKEIFLNNKINKSNFVLLPKQHLESRRVRTKQATGDADCLISETGVHLSSLGTTSVIGIHVMAQMMSLFAN